MGSGEPGETPATARGRSPGRLRGASPGSGVAGYDLVLKWVDNSMSPQ
jgi:hypothetical protein